MADEEKSPYKPFQPVPVEPKYGRDRGFGVTHTKLDLRLDHVAKTVSGTATLTITPFHALGEFELDAEDLHVSSVKINGKRVAFETHHRKLMIHPVRKLKEGEKVEIAIKYEAKPRRGLYFVSPDKAYPKKPYQIWSQGESEDNHAWFPGYDHPNNKASSEAILTVRAPLVAISNGHLASKEEPEKGWIRYRWLQEVPQPNYLIAVVAGEFDEIRAQWNGLPLSYFVPKGTRKWGEETFKQTPKILDYFSRVTGYKYPYPKYAQAIVADFMWGGMENTSITTVNERFLIGPEHRDDANPDGLVAHEAAHQWFGDLVTTKGWEHLWLNEGFATYFDALFHEDFYGQDWFQLEMWENAEAYLDEDTRSYRRPLVTRDYLEPEDLFDRHTYQKGSLVLHMLRKELGDAVWWKAIRHYVKKFEWKNVESGDFRTAIEESTGRNLDWFFDQWVYKAGHPDLEARWDYDPSNKFVKLSLKQTQKVAGDTPLFRLNLEVWVWTDAKIHKVHKIRFGKAEEHFFLPAGNRPECVQVDPEGWILKKMKFDKDAKEWSFQLQHGPGAHARFEAAENLAKKASDPAALPALEKALRDDRFWGTRRAASLALGEHLTADARDVLVRGLKDKHPRVRRAAANALGNFQHDPKAARALSPLIQRDRSDYVRAACLLALAKTRDASALAVLRKNLTRSSHNDVVASAALTGMGELKDPKAVPDLTRYTRYGLPQLVRSSATVGLGRLWDFVDKKTQFEIRQTFKRLLRDPLHQQRRAALLALRDAADPELQGIVAEVAENDAIGLIRHVARQTMRVAREKMGMQAQVSELKQQLEQAKTDHKKLQATVNALEAQVRAARRKKK